ncbi:MAG: 3-deoxy-D-manno-octulosonic acid transferase [Planctomycetes bacterium]|nr:3-deoxy-D-manno-octulosonic acid transferase [Planctomycetota bacterium]
MGILLNIGYGLAGLLASPYLLFKFATDERYRDRLEERLGEAPERKGDAPCLWFHCASVGEVNVIRPLVKELKHRRPDLALHVSTLTQAGLENAQKAFPEACTHYWPLDFTFAARQAIERVRPTAIALVELEVWPNFTEVAERLGVPMIVVNGRLSRRSHRRYRRFSWFWRPIFRRISQYGAQSEDHAKRFRDLGLDDGRVTVTGNLKYDAAIAFDPDTAARELRPALGLRDGEPLLVCGSTHDPEEKIIAETYLKIRPSHPDLRLLVAPRHLERAADVEKIFTGAGLPCARRSAGPAPADAVILLDTVGELAKVYALAGVVFIGGTFCVRGGQNMLEPAALGKPVVSGPSLDNFREIADALIAVGGMRVVHNSIDLPRALSDLLGDPTLARVTGEMARKAVEAGKGAIQATASLLESVLGV